MEGNKNRNINLRYNIIIVLTIVVGIILIIQLFNLQIIHGDEYRAMSSGRLTRETKIYADRGEILDRNGMKLVTTSSEYDLCIYKTTTDAELLNDNIVKIIEVLEENGDKYKDNLILTVNPYGYSTDNQEVIERFKKNNNINKDYTAEQCFNALKDKFKIKYDDDELARKVMAVRYEIYRNGYSNIRPALIANNISKESVLKFSEQNSNFFGIDIRNRPIVTYNNGTLASHVLGYCGQITEEELDKFGEGYDEHSIIGKNGIQYVFEKYLKGENGIRQVDMDVSGNITGEYITKEPIVGSDVELTIDAKIQSVLEESLKADIEKIASGGYAERSNAKSGAAVVMNIKTGEILALASYPDYEPQLFTDGISSEKYKEYIENESLYNRAISGAYAPGSTFKMITAMAGLETGKVGPYEPISCQGVYPHAHKPVCWYYTLYRGGHGSLTMSQAIEQSCNYFFYEVGHRIGINTLSEYAKYFGLGRKTGIELIGESSGNIASKDRAIEENRDWYDGETLSASIGQSYNNVTPVQMARYISTLVNGGHQIDVTLIKSIITPDGEEIPREEIESHVNNLLGIDKNEEVNEKIFADENLSVVLQGMKNVTTETGGTAYSAFKDCPIGVGGKTGSAQAGDKTHAWFVGFAPFDDPEIAVVVIIENGAHGSYAAQVARDVIDAYFFED